MWSLRLGVALCWHKDLQGNCGHKHGQGYAPIFSKSDYGIIGDLFEVVLALTRELEKQEYLNYDNVSYSQISNYGYLARYGVLPL